MQKCIHGIELLLVCHECTKQEPGERVISRGTSKSLSFSFFVRELRDLTDEAYELLHRNSDEPDPITEDMQTIYDGLTEAMQRKYVEQIARLFNAEARVGAAKRVVSDLERSLCG